MKVFISWSGERSKAVAELLSEWIECVIQAVEPWVSSKDIDRGSLWFTEISEQLATVSVGIVCLTADNKDKPWILFESGALAKGLSTNRVCTFLIDLQSGDLENPLAQFNHTFPNKDGLLALIRTINATLGENKLKDEVVLRVFETYWPDFENKFRTILESIPSGAVAEKRPEESILSELLSTVRSMDKRLRTVEHDDPAFKFKRGSGPSSKLYIEANDGSVYEKHLIIKLLSEGIENKISETDIKNSVSKKLNISLSVINKLYSEAGLDLF